MTYCVNVGINVANTVGSDVTSKGVSATNLTTLKLRMSQKMVRVAMVNCNWRNEMIAKVFLILVAISAVASGQTWQRYDESKFGLPSDSTIYSHSWKEGDQGYLRSLSFSVVQVVDGANAIVSVKSDGGVNESNGTIFWLSTPTKGMVDDMRIQIIDPVKVVGTKKYDTVSGSSSTIWKLETLSGDDLKKYKDQEASRSEKANRENKDRMAKEQKDREKAIEDQEYRTFKSADGKFSVEAKFVEMKVNPKTGTDIKLIKREDKKEVVVRSTVLSESDMKWIREKVKADKKIKDQAVLDAKLIRNGVQRYSPEWYSLGGSKEPGGDSFKGFDQ